MKQLVSGITTLLLFLAGTSAVWAAERGSLGFFHLGVKVDYLEFTDNVVADLDLESGPFYAVEAYAQVLRDVYAGVEVGYFNQEEDFGQEGGLDLPGLSLDLELTYIPLELNLKYTESSGPLVWDVGVGASYNYVDLEGSALLMDIEEDDWLWGGQLFAEVGYRLGSFFAGLNGKYQVVEEDLDNWRLGGQLGIFY